MSRKPYPSDLSDAEWEKIKPLLPQANKLGSPRIVDLREVLNAIFYNSILQFFAICRKILSWYTIARIGNVSQCSITVYQNLC
jgi:hypothetical protein